MEHNVNKVLEEILGLMLQGHPDIKISLQFSDNLYEDAISLCENNEYKEFMLGQSFREIKQCNALNGMYLHPKDINSKQIILISSRQLNDGYSYVSTAAHETRHAIDYTAFAKLYCNEKYEGIGDHEYGGLFYVWSEYVAHKIGHSIFIKYAMNLTMGMSENKIIDELANNQMPHRLNAIKQQIMATATRENVKEVISTLSKFAIWEEDFNIDINCLPDVLLTLLHNLNKYSHVEDIHFPTLQKWLDRLCYYMK